MVNLVFPFTKSLIIAFTVLGEACHCNMPPVLGVTLGVCDFLGKRAKVSPTLCGNIPLAGIPIRAFEGKVPLGSICAGSYCNPGKVRLFYAERVTNSI